MKIVKNNCYGGYSISPKAIKRLAELDGKECYFFEGGLSEDYEEITEEEAKHNLFTFAFSVKNPNDLLPKTKLGEHEIFNKVWETIYLTSTPYRTNPNLIKVIEELGKEANSRLSRLEIVEIPDDVKWEIEEYDGLETIREQSRTW